MRINIKITIWIFKYESISDVQGTKASKKIDQRFQGLLS